MTDASIRRLGGGSGSGLTNVYSETPSGTVNGTNTDFTLAHTPSSGTLALYLNGARQKLTDDYTLVGAVITFLSAPLTNSLILADYAY